MPFARLVLLVSLALIAFAGNSLLCRAALGGAHIDAASFTSVRLLSGAITLFVLAALRQNAPAGRGSWRAAIVLFVYAISFSLSYAELSAAAGALLLFGAVQISMIAYGLLRGERMRPLQWLGLACACGGLIELLLPGLAAPPAASALLMLLSGLGWGAYSLLGRGSGDPIRINAGNFVRVLPFTLALSVALYGQARADAAGLLYAGLSGAVTSGVGYSIWYAALPSLRATTAAALQLAVPVIAALGGVVLLDEALTPRLLAASAAILGGIAIVLLCGRRKSAAIQACESNPGA